jgi:hypothetical protein
MTCELPFSPDSALILRRANVSRKGGAWQHEDYDVFDGERDVGRRGRWEDVLPPDAVAHMRACVTYSDRRHFSRDVRAIAAWCGARSVIPGLLPAPRRTFRHCQLWPAKPTGGRLLFAKKRRGGRSRP